MTYEDDYLAHFGIKGMRWGVRRYQNEDRTLTEAGKKRYGKEGKSSALRTAHDLNKVDRESTVSKSRSETHRLYEAEYERRAKKREKKGKSGDFYRKIGQKHKIKSEEYDRLAKEGHDFINAMLKSAANSGKSVHSKNVYRYSGHQNGWEKYTVGKHYRVKNDGKGERTHNPNHLSEDAQQFIMRYYYYY